jgi:hypothetical protein
MLKHRKNQRKQGRPGKKRGEILVDHERSIDLWWFSK